MVVIPGFQTLLSCFRVGKKESNAIPVLCLSLCMYVCLSEKERQRHRQKGIIQILSFFLVNCNRKKIVRSLAPVFGGRLY